MECLKRAWLVPTFLILLSLAAVAPANLPPELTSQRRLVITGVGTNDIHTKLLAEDIDGDSFTFALASKPPSSLVNSTTIDKKGTITFKNVCATCTGTAKFRVKLTDSLGNSRSYNMLLEVKDRTGKLKATPESANDMGGERGLLRWHIYLIIMSVILTAGVILSLVMYNCCTFTPDLYDIPIKRPNRVEDKKPEKEDWIDSMNPFARPKKMSLLVKESVRSGAADGTPYYGTRKSGVWIPNNLGDGEPGRPQPLRLMSIADDQPARKESLAQVPARRESVAPTQGPPPAASSGNGPRKQSLSQNTTEFNQLSWYDISAPKQ